MGILKNILKRFTCNSKCTFNTDDFDNNLKQVDLSKYQLKVSDLLRIQKIVNKRPSINGYFHELKEDSPISQPSSQFTDV